MGSKKRYSEDYDVGFGKPPKNWQFKKGKSGNPKGRPKKSKNLNTLLEAELESRITVREGDQEKRVTKRQAIVKRVVQGALNNDAKHLLFLFRYLDGRNDPDSFRITPEDEAEIAALVAKAGKEASDESQS